MISVALLLLLAGMALSYAGVGGGELVLVKVVSMLVSGFLLAWAFYVVTVRMHGLHKARIGRSRYTGPAQRWAIGAAAEVKVGERLNRLGKGYEVAHDVLVRRASGATAANIDHLVRTPNGALVLIDTKCWAGQLASKDGRFMRADTGTFGGPRGVAVDTLRWLADQLSREPDAIVVVVEGRGTIKGGRLTLPGSGQHPPIVAIKAAELDQELAAVRRRGRRVDSLRSVR